jgi:hypothetical protein
MKRHHAGRNDIFPGRLRAAFIRGAELGTTRSGIGAMRRWPLAASGILVAGSGCSEASRPKNCSGEDAPNTGDEILPICHCSPLGRLNCNAKLRCDLVLSAALGLALPTDKRITTGTGLPLKAEAVDSARASAVPTNSPIAQMPLAPERRRPSNLPNVDSNWFKKVFGSTGAVVDDCANEFELNTAAAAATAQITSFVIDEAPETRGVVGGQQTDRRSGAISVA